MMPSLPKVFRSSAADSAGQVARRLDQFADKYQQFFPRVFAYVYGRVRNVHETEDALLAETEKTAKVACTGPAGEKLSRIAAVMNDKHRAAARSGVGAVMGSKNLKAVVVLGSAEVPLAEPEQ